MNKHYLLRGRGMPDKVNPLSVLGFVLSAAAVAGIFAYMGINW